MMANLSARLVAWYNEKIVKGWYKTYTVMMAAAALLLPDILQQLLQIGVDNLDAVYVLIGPMEETTKLKLRLALIALIPVVRAIKQPKLQPPQEPANDPQ